MDLRMREITKQINPSEKIRYSVCVDCEKEGVEITPIPIRSMGQWTYEYECPRCHRTAYDIDFEGEILDGVL